MLAVWLYKTGQIIYYTVRQSAQELVFCACMPRVRQKQIKRCSMCIRQTLDLTLVPLGLSNSSLQWTKHALFCTLATVKAPLQPLSQQTFLFLFFQTLFNPFIIILLLFILSLKLLTMNIKILSWYFANETFFLCLSSQLL